MRTRTLRRFPAPTCYLRAGFGLVRKEGKLYQTHSVSYDLEYGTDTIEMHVDTV